MDKWQNSVAVVTGANSGIGFTIFKQLAENGIKVVGLDIYIETINKLKADTKNDNIHAIVCDITKDDQTEAAFKWIEDTLGGCDILVNNAGILRTIGILEYDKPMKELEFNVNINYTAHVRVSRLAFKSMATRDKYGYIINISSVCGHSVVPVMDNGSIGVYNGTKYAMTATNEVMRFELNQMKNRKVRVTNIAPGVVLTNLYKNADVKTDDEDAVYKNPILRAKDVADQVIYLLTTPYEVHITNLIVRATGADL
ncbi:farnesol dehydrogenase-like [Chironomus tepperi]|uniref:farnesol dehydrogenase-like n=1 Tax=Chironomus tepperi TaxID=113505 RepID=UPI00391FB798